MGWRRKLICTACGGTGPFFADKKGKFGKANKCKKCCLNAQTTRRATPRGRALTMWNAVLERCVQNKYYLQLEVRISREDFIRWAVRALTKWMRANPGVSPSLDRIKSSRHYEKGNLRITSRGENTRNREWNKNLVAPEGTSWCGGKCQKYLTTDKFAPSSKSVTGAQSYCRKCIAQYRADHRVLTGRFKTRRLKKRDW